MIRNPLALGLAAALAAAAIAGCDDEDADRVVPVQPADGTYRAVAASGHDPADEAALLQTTAVLDRAGGTLVVSRGGTSAVTLSFTPRARSAWRGDCVTMGGHALNEVADLAPGPLELAPSFVLASPVVFPKCSPTRLLLSSGPEASEAGPLLVLDLVPDAR